MATINDFKREISELVKAQKVAKRINHQSEVYRNRGLLHARNLHLNSGIKLLNRMNWRCTLKALPHAPLVQR